MRKCSKEGCPQPALGWGVLVTGGSTTVHTCDTHTSDELKQQLRDYKPGVKTITESPSTGAAYRPAQEVPTDETKAASSPAKPTHQGSK